MYTYTIVYHPMTLDLTSISGSQSQMYTEEYTIQKIQNASKNYLLKKMTLR